MATPTKLTPPATEPTSIERVEAWTVSQVADILNTTTISPSTPPKPTRNVSLAIPLDTSILDADPTPPRKPSEPTHTVYKRQEPIRRDSLKRREALLKGKEGSRQRRRWENDRLLGNPHAQPPLPEDWEVRPTHPRHTIPYFLAPLWDAEYARTAAQREVKEARAKAPKTKEEAKARQVQRELRDVLKRAKGAKPLLMDLEESVRGFVGEWEVKRRELEQDGLVDGDSEDEEIVFVGRNGVMSDERRKEREVERLEKDRVIFESLVHDHGAAFGRFLVHAIAQYYDLESWSATTGDAPPKRQAYVGVKTDPVTRRPSLTRTELPRPLWTVV